MKLESMEIEQHPLEPFLPGNARLLMLGSFPPQKKRWSMEFYYPNWNNDMWRITGFLFFNDKDYFVDKTKKAFCKERLISFLQERVLPCSTQPLPYGACRTTPRISFWKWCNPRTSLPCYTGYRNARLSLPPARRQRTRCARSFPSTSPK